MKVLVIHNRYKQQGGEDHCFKAEVDMLKSHGITVETMVFHNDDIHSWISMVKLSYASIFNIHAAKKIQLKIDYFQPDIIHVHNFFYIISPSVFWTAKRNGIPVVFTVHNYRLICSGALLMRDNQVCELCIQKKFPIHGVKYKCHRGSAIQTAQLTFLTGIHKVMGTWTHKVDRYIALTAFAKQKLLSSGLKLKDSQLVIKPNFCADHGFTAFETRGDHYLFIGRLSHEKGLHILLEALKLKDFKLKIVGSGPMEDRVKQCVSEHRNLTYLGQMPNEAVKKELKMAKALLFPSTWYEGMPMTILEAYSTGTPVISTDIDNINEIVIDQYNGLHFSNGNSQSLVKVLDDFEHMDDPGQIYLNARKTFEEKYTAEVNFKRLTNIYQSLLDKEL